MRRSVLIVFAPLLVAMLAMIAGAQRQQVEAGQETRAAIFGERWLPEACLLVMGVERALPVADDRGGESDEARWNRLYRLGIEALGVEDLATAELRYCQALDAAASFGPRDVRFAETLDELGLVRYSRGDYDGAEAMQGAAVAEMLLAVGPPEGDVVELAAKSCHSSVATYLTRLGWVYDRQGRGDEIAPLLEAPHRILAKGYVPAESLRARLDWLISRYLLIEDFATADWLSALREEAR